MRRFSSAFEVKADIDRVWDFYTSVDHLGIITPPAIKLQILKCTTGKRLEAGSEVWIEGQLVTKSRWHSRITQLEPYQYIDEMLSGRFKVWKHVHIFEKADAGTKVIDEIDFELPYGLLGRMFEGYTSRQLEKIFAHRKQATILALENVD